MKTTEQLKRGMKVWCGKKHKTLTYAGIRSINQLTGERIWVFYDNTGRQRWLTDDEVNCCSITE